MIKIYPFSRQNLCSAQRESYRSEKKSYTQWACMRLMSSTAGHRGSLPSFQVSLWLDSIIYTYWLLQGHKLLKPLVLVNMYLLRASCKTIMHMILEPLVAGRPSNMDVCSVAVSVQLTICRWHGWDKRGSSRTNQCKGGRVERGGKSGDCTWGESVVVSLFRHYGVFSVCLCAGPVHWWGTHAGYWVFLLPEPSAGGRHGPHSHHGHQQRHHQVRREAIPWSLSYYSRFCLKIMYGGSLSALN